MSRKPARIADLDQLVERMTALGLDIEAVEITVDGALRVLTHRPAGGVGLNDDLDWVELAGQAKAVGRA